MQSNEAILKELREVQAAQQVLSERATELINQLEGVSTPSSSRKGRVDVMITSRVLARRRESAFKK